MIAVEGDPILFNPYGVIAVNPDKNPQIRGCRQPVHRLARLLPTQEVISGYGVEAFGSPLVPDSEAWRNR